MPNEIDVCLIPGDSMPDLSDLCHAQNLSDICYLLVLLYKHSEMLRNRHAN